MGPTIDWVTLEQQERNPFFSIAALVVALAVVAGLAGRYGVNNVVVLLCVAAAVVGTLLLLSPRIEVLQTMPGSQPGSPPTTNGISAFGGGDMKTRQGLRGAPREAVGFTDEEPAEPRVGAAQRPALDRDSFADSVVPVRALGQLPQDASGITIETTVDVPGNVSGAYTLGQFEIRGVSRRGSDHVILNDPRQDDFVVASAANGRYLIAIVADGHGPAENAHYGSYWAARLLAQAIDQHLRDGVPGIENMLSRTRDELSQLFDLRFTDGTKMRTIATTLAGVIAPVDGGPAAGFRVGGPDILARTGHGWSSIFATPVESDTLFPRVIEAEVVPLELEGQCLLIAADGVASPIGANVKIAQSFSETLEQPVGEVEFDQLLSFPLEEARGDRTAIALWFNED